MKGRLDSFHTQSTRHARLAPPPLSEFGTDKTVKARFWSMTNTGHVTHEQCVSNVTAHLKANLSERNMFPRSSVVQPRVRRAHLKSSMKLSLRDTKVVNEVEHG